MGLINKTGKILTNPQFDEPINFINGFAIVSKQGKFGVLDTKGNYKIPVKYDEIKHIYKNYYIAKLDNKWGVIDINNKVVKEFGYDNAIVVNLDENSKTQLFLIKGTKGLVLDFKN
ncbi:WG repeat-containing protein [Clostridium massiliodielmoense]|uniref:WG repeat-containing protein n=1 Tax=Clostridium massiliodielmoense TaxID=1776385 RepID=UPI000A26CC9D|nr:WG repeat-containing protein [Clostridium massiliodielmoense]